MGPVVRTKEKPTAVGRSHGANKPFYFRYFTGLVRLLSIIILLLRSLFTKYDACVAVRVRGL